MKAVDCFDAESFVFRKNITVNKHGVLFTDGKLIMISDLRSEIIKSLPSNMIFTDRDFREAISRIDLYAKQTKQSSVYFRKSKIKYGLFKSG